MPAESKALDSIMQLSAHSPATIHSPAAGNPPEPDSAGESELKTTNPDLIGAELGKPRKQCCSEERERRADSAGESELKTSNSDPIEPELGKLRKRCRSEERERRADSAGESELKTSNPDPIGPELGKPRKRCRSEERERRADSAGESELKTSNPDPIGPELGKPRKRCRSEERERRADSAGESELKMSNPDPIGPELGKPRKRCRSEERERQMVLYSPLRKSPRLLSVASRTMAAEERGSKKPRIGGSSGKEVELKRCSMEVLGGSKEIEEMGNGNREEIVNCDGEETSELENKIPFLFVGEPVSEEEAQRRWGWRYEMKNQKAKRQCWKLNADDEDEIILNVKCHYTQARAHNCVINLGDCALIKGDGVEKHVGKILEFFQTTDDEDYFRVQWFYRAEDTVLQKQAASHDKKRLFYSTVMNDNLLDCIISKISVTELTPTLSSRHRCTSSDFYYDMEYCVEYSTFRNLRKDDSVKSSEKFAPGVSEALKAIIASTPLEKLPSHETCKPELALLDLYSGCGGMSTGLCLGAKLSSVNLVTRWAVDASQAACDSLKLNHPETQVRKQNAEDFLELLKEWEKLCQRYVLSNVDKALRSREDGKNSKDTVKSPRDIKVSAGEYEVQRLVDICYGDPSKTGKRGVYFKVRWLGYSSSDDTWEPMESLSNCQERIEDFVKRGYKSKIVPLPGDVDVLCGGPPCQGISGYNRYRNIISPLTDEKNRQLIVFMDIVKFLRPKYVLMENVNDILKFDKASLGRYALSRLIHMRYQARLGSMASGCYGLPQFRLRVFLWGALPSEKLPQFPLPSHDVVVKYWPATEFERNTVAYDEGQHRDLEKAVILRDAISDLQAVTSQETRDEMPYELPPETEFQRFIRLTKDEMMGVSGKRSEDAQNTMLYDHRPLPLTDDDNLRVSQIPHKKGANFRDLPGVIVGPDNVAYWDPKNETKLPSGKPLVPNSAFNFEQGKSKRPYARVWWDETVATIVTYPNLRAQAVLHPDQDRVFTIREFARLQGFPDYYRFCGSVIERYRQVGNAVSVPVSRALGYCLGMAIRKLGGDEPLLTLPPKFAVQRIPTNEITILN